MKLLFTLLLAFLTCFNIALGQDTTETNKPENFRTLFTDASFHIEYGNYNLALPLYLKLDSIEPNNANIQYRIGLCYSHSTNEKNKAITYFENALLSITSNYNDLAFTEKNAPLVAYYELAKAYHENYQIDTAIATFKKFQTLIHTKHYLQEDLIKYLKTCEFIKKQTSNPIEVEIINLGEELNSEYSDFGPVINADESMLIFTSRRKGSTGRRVQLDGKYFEDIYVSYKTDGNWQAPKKIGPSINTSDHDAAIGLSPDGQTLYIYKDDNGNGNIYESSLIGDTWTVPEKLNDNINSVGWETHASISADGNRFYFVSDRKGGFGGRDIYVCKTLPNGGWALAQNLGPEINTKYDEEAPYIHPNGTTLYFSSNGHQTMGGFDILSAELNTENGLWSKPTNMGYPLNTTHDDIFFVPTTDGKRAYYSSVEKQGYGEKDLYLAVFNNVEEIGLTVLKGVMVVEDENGIPAEAEIIISDNSNPDGMPKIAKPNSATGKYIVILNPGRDYNISYILNDSVIHAENIFIPEESNYQEIERTIDLKTVELDGSITEKYSEKDELQESAVTNQDETPTISEVIPELSDLQFFYSIDSANGEPENITKSVMGKIVFKTLPLEGKGQKIMLVNDKGETLYTTTTNELGEFTFKSLPFELDYIIESEIELVEAEMKIFKEGEEIATLTSDENNQYINIQSTEKEEDNLAEEETKQAIEEATKKVQDLIKIAEEEAKQKAEEEKLSLQNEVIETLDNYREYFIYNKIKIDTKNIYYNQFIEGVIVQLKNNETISIQIEASASTVPTKKYNTNKNLAQIRGQEAKKLILSSLSQKGISTNNVAISIDSKVNGPTYQDDATSNKIVYEKYQYIFMNYKDK